MPQELRNLSYLLVSFLCLDAFGRFGGFQCVVISAKGCASTVNLLDTRNMAILRMIYLALAIWGAIHPMSWFIAWFNENGYSLAGMVEAWHANAATSGLVWDLTIAAVALTVWIIAEVYTRKNWLALVAIPATFCIGVSCGLPLYLFLRTRPVT